MVEFVLYKEVSVKKDIQKTSSNTYLLVAFWAAAVATRAATERATMLNCILMECFFLGGELFG